MRKLRKNFKRLSIKDRLKFVMFLPLLCSMAIIDSGIDVLTFIVRWLVNFIKWNWRHIVVVTVAVIVVAIPIQTIVHIDQTVPKFRGHSDESAERYVYFNCHEMTNRFIVAEDGNIRGYVRADDNNIDRIISVIVEHDMNDQDILISWLMSFKDGDYSDAVAFHNYCWEELGGEVGYAIGLRDRYK